MPGQVFDFVVGGVAKCDAHDLLDGLYYWTWALEDYIGKPRTNSEKCLLTACVEQDKSKY